MCVLAGGCDREQIFTHHPCRLRCRAEAEDNRRKERETAMTDPTPGQPMRRASFTPRLGTTVFVQAETGAHELAERLSTLLCAEDTPMYPVESREIGTTRTRPTHDDGRPALKLLPTDEDLVHLCGARVDPTAQERAEQRNRLDRAWRIILHRPGETIARRREALEGLRYEIKPPIMAGGGYLVIHGSGWTSTEPSLEMAVARATEREMTLFAPLPAAEDLSPPFMPHSACEMRRTCGDHGRCVGHCNAPAIDLAAGVVDMIERGILTPGTAPDDFDFIRAAVGIERADEALARFQASENPFNALARAARDLIELVDECDFGAGASPLKRSATFGRESHSFVRLARSLEVALEAWSTAEKS